MIRNAVRGYLRQPSTGVLGGILLATIGTLWLKGAAEQLGEHARALQEAVENDRARLAELRHEADHQAMRSAWHNDRVIKLRRAAAGLGTVLTEPPIEAPADAGDR